MGKLTVENSAYKWLLAGSGVITLSRTLVSGLKQMVASITPKITTEGVEFHAFCQDSVERYWYETADKPTLEEALEWVEGELGKTWRNCKEIRKETT